MEYALLKSLVEKRLPAIDIKNPEALARAVYDACVEYAEGVGMKPEIECAFKEPGAQVHTPPQNGWTVVFEAGPYDWGVNLSLWLICEKGAQLCEPYYGFDLTFYRSEVSEPAAPAAKAQATA